eukprot:gene5545-4000_t
MCVLVTGMFLVPKHVLIFIVVAAFSISLLSSSVSNTTILHSFPQSLPTLLSPPMCFVPTSDTVVPVVAPVESKPVQADRYKTRLCDKFMATGFCPYEVRCMFAHGESELRTAEDNIRDGLVTEEAIRAFRAKFYGSRRQQRHRQRYAFYPSYPYSCYCDEALPPAPAYGAEYRHHPYVNVLDEPVYLECEAEYFPAEEMEMNSGVSEPFPAYPEAVKAAPPAYGSGSDCGERRLSAVLWSRKAQRDSLHKRDHQHRVNTDKKKNVFPHHRLPLAEHRAGFSPLPSTAVVGRPAVPVWARQGRAGAASHLSIATVSRGRSRKAGAAQRLCWMINALFFPFNYNYFSIRTPSKQFNEVLHCS